jgi:hypothetical protein
MLSFAISTKQNRGDTIVSPLGFRMLINMYNEMKKQEYRTYHLQDCRIGQIRGWHRSWEHDL